MSALTSLLVRDEVVPVYKVEEALRRQVVSGADIETVLLEMRAVPEDTLSAYCAAVFGLLPATRDEVMRAPRDVVRLVSAETAARHGLVPLRAGDGVLTAAAARPIRQDDREDLSARLGMAVVIRIATPLRIAAGLGHHYCVEMPSRLRLLADALRAADPGEVAYVAASLGEAPRAPSSAPPATSSRPPAPPRPSSVSPLVGVAPVIAVGHSEKPSALAEAPSSARMPATAMRTALDVLARATTRDAITEAMFEYSRQFFEYVALFVVRGDIAEGRDAAGAGATAAAVCRMAVPLDVPGAFATASATGAPRVARFGASPLDRVVASGLGRDQAPNAAVVPVCMRGRSVLLVYGDRGSEPFALPDIGDLCAYATRVGEALEMLIGKRKAAASGTASE